MDMCDPRVDDPLSLGDLPELSSLFPNGCMQYDTTMPQNLFSDTGHQPMDLDTEEPLSKVSIELSSDLYKTTNCEIPVLALQELAGKPICGEDADLSPNPALSGLDDCSNFTVADDSEDSSSSFFQNGIAANDVGSLLEQFEASAASFPSSPLSAEEITDKVDTTQASSAPLEKPDLLQLQDSDLLKLLTSKQKPTSQVSSPALTPPGTPPPEIIEKIKASAKKRSAILLPMGLPAKVGRGQGTEVPSMATPRTLQRIIKQQTGNTGANVERAEGQAATSDSSAKPKVTEESTSSAEVTINSVVCSVSYYDAIPDHDYCQNVPLRKEKSPVTCVKSGEDKVVSPTQDAETDLNPEGSVLKSLLLSEQQLARELGKQRSRSSLAEIHDNSLTDNTKEDHVCDEYEGKEWTGIKTLEGAVSSETPAGQSESCQSSSVPNKTNSFRKSVRLQNKIGRQYRKREQSPTVNTESLYDKVPQYITRLAMPAKPGKQKPGPTKTLLDAKLPERDPSPEKESLFDKLPAYYSCFTNSTKYDATSDPLAIENGTSEVCSTQSSRSQSPALVIASRENSCVTTPNISRAPSRERSVSKSKSPGKTPSRSDSSSSSSRSRSRSKTRSRSWRRGRSRKRSYSSSSQSSSSSSSRSRSRSNSRSQRRSSRKRSWSGSSTGSTVRRGSRSRSKHSSRRSSRSSRSGPRHRRKRRKYRSRSSSYEDRWAEDQKRKDEEKRIRIEQRRIVYVGRIADDFTRRDLKRRFERFGEIEDVSVHFREHGDNYGFVTYVYTCDAFAAIEKGNSVPGMEEYDLCFGGRREFCQTEYMDLDGNMEDEEELAPVTRSSSALDFDSLLQQARKKLTKT